MDGLEATRRIMADPRCANTHVLVLTTFDEDDLVHEALRAGASGFLLKDTRPTQLLEAIAVVAGGDALLAPSVTRRLIEQFTTLPSRPVARGEDDLTDREREVLAACPGLSNQEIADSLHMGYGTVKTHVSHLLTKLDCRDRAQLVMHAYESGLPSPGPADLYLRSLRPGLRTDVYPLDHRHWWSGQPGRSSQRSSSRDPTTSELIAYLVIAYSVAIGIAVAMPPPA